MAGKYLMQTSLAFCTESSDRRYSHLPPKNEKTTQATSGLLFTARRLVKLSGDQGFQSPVAYSVIKNPKTQTSRAKQGRGNKLVVCLEVD